MASSELIKVPPGERLPDNDEVLRQLPDSLFNDYRSYEHIQIQRFNNTRWNKQREFDYKHEGADKSNDKYKTELKQYEDKVLEAWRRVLKVLNNRKTTNLKKVGDIAYTKRVTETDYRIPQAGRWITFPLWNGDRIGPDSDKQNGKQMTITWSAANSTFSAIYYKTTCWWGTLDYYQAPNVESAPPGNESKVSKKDSDQNEKAAPEAVEKAAVASVPEWKAHFTPFGETELYIASEFLDSRYQGAPFLGSLHLKDRFPPNTKWAHMRLDPTFHYGQNYKNPTYRYIVYHPFVRTRPVPQKAFTENTAARAARNFATAAITAATVLVPHASAPTNAASNVLTDLAIEYLSHELHRFTALPDEGYFRGAPSPPADEVPIAPENNPRVREAQAEQAAGELSPGNLNPLEYSINGEVTQQEHGWNKEDRSLKPVLPEAVRGIEIVEICQDFGNELGEKMQAEAAAQTLDEKGRTIEKRTETTEKILAVMRTYERLVTDSVEAPERAGGTEDQKQQQGSEAVNQNLSVDNEAEIPSENKPNPLPVPGSQAWRQPREARDFIIKHDIEINGRHFFADQHQKMKATKSALPQTHGVPVVLPERGNPKTSNQGGKELLPLTVGKTTESTDQQPSECRRRVTAGTDGVRDKRLTRNSQSSNPPLRK